MTRREKHKIESNCVSFDDDCHNETNSYAENSQTVTAADNQILSDTFSSVYKSGQSFIKNLEKKLSLVKQSNKGEPNNV
jgi:hypothetical protein